MSIECLLGREIQIQIDKKFIIWFDSSTRDSRVQFTLAHSPGCLSSSTIQPTALGLSVLPIRSYLPTANGRRIRTDTRSGGQCTPGSVSHIMRLCHENVFPILCGAFPAFFIHLAPPTPAPSSQRLSSPPSRLLSHLHRRHRRTCSLDSAPCPPSQSASVSAYRQSVGIEIEFREENPAGSCSCAKT